LPEAAIFAVCVMYISSTMKTNILVADDDMDVQQLMCDVLEISLRNVRVERAMSLQGFWAKLPASPEQQPWHSVFLSVDYIKEEPAGFMERLRAAKPDEAGKVVIVGTAADAADIESYAEAAGEGLKTAPFLVKPFSLDGFEEFVKRLCGS
jgi:response regulator RpfG family c-di-GMP phosphodiesterase